MASANLNVRAPTIPALLDLCAKENKEATFLLGHDNKFNQHSVTFGQLRIEVIKAAHHLQQVGVHKGERCALLFDYNESAIINILAVMSLGAVVVLANRQIPPHILSQMFKSSHVKFLYVENAAETDLILARENNVKIIDSATTQNGRENGVDNIVSHLEDVLPSDPALILFTSGTTSIPKGVLHSHSNLLNAVEGKRITFESILVPNGTVLGILPLFHALGFTSTFLFCLYNGLRYACFQLPATPELYAAAIKLVKPFYFDTVPWVVEELTAMCKGDKVLLTELQNLTHFKTYILDVDFVYLSASGGRMSPSIGEFCEKNNIPIGADWGQTELGSSALHAGFTSEPERWRFMRPVHGVTAELMPVEGLTEGGELVIINSKTLALGYVVDGKLVPLSREAYRTNDIFIQNAAGEFAMLVRKDAVIVHVNGEKTNPVPFCPAIKHVCVIGSDRPHNMLLIQVTEDHISLNTEQEVWNFVEAANADLPPHSRVRRHQIELVPSTTVIPLNLKGEVIVRQVETLFAEQIDKVGRFKNSSFLATQYPEGFLEGLKRESAFERKRLMTALVRDVVSAILGYDSERLELETSFQEQGVRSFEAMQVKNTLSAILEGVGQLPATMLYDHPTIVSLAEWLLQLVGLGELNVPKAVIGADQPSEKMALIGVGLRFGAGARDMETFWKVLSNGIDAVTLIPPERWDWEKYWDPAGGPGKLTFSEGAFISDHDQFDPNLFGILPKEAHEMDPQHRLLLECTWEAIEHAGYSPESFRGSNTGVFLGMLQHD